MKFTNKKFAGFKRNFAAVMLAACMIITGLSSCSDRTGMDASKVSSSELISEISESPESVSSADTSDNDAPESDEPEAIESDLNESQSIGVESAETSEESYIEADPLSEKSDGTTTASSGSSSQSEKSSGENSFTFNLSDIPAYSGSPYAVVNNNIPGFTESDLTTSSFETYGSLDSLGRCTTAYANIGKDLMPTESRGSIGQVKPSGWHTVKYDCVDGKYLYNRCHLIGYQLTAENANEKNLITGTRYLNVDGMLPFENMVADYIKETGNHVLYRVTPIFEGSNLVASGVLMEAKSVEDDGDGILFNVYCYNVQPGVTIDYKTGDSSLGGTAAASSSESSALEISSSSEDSTSKEVETSSETASASSSSESSKSTYILNTSTHKFHTSSCSSVSQMKADNKKEYYGTRDEVIKLGYEPCGRCKP